MISNLESFLQNIKVPPNIITIAKSSSDSFDYTPIDQVSFIEKQVMEMIKRLWFNTLVQRK